MIDREVALEIQRSALDAVVKLSSILNDIQGRCPDEDFEIIKKGVGYSIGDIYVEILNYLYSQHPDIDHTVK